MSPPTYRPSPPPLPSPPNSKDATKARLKDIVRDIAERRDMKDDPEGPIDSNSLWAVKPDRDMPQDTAQARIARPVTSHQHSRRCASSLGICTVF